MDGVIMENARASHFVFNGEDDKFVLIYKDFIFADIERNEIEECISDIDRCALDVSSFKKVVRLSQVFEYEFEENDSAILFGEVVAKTKRYETVGFVDNAELCRAEKVLIEGLTSQGLIREKRPLSALSAALVPAILLAITLALGGFFSWWAYKIEIGEWPTRTTIVKSWVMFSYLAFKASGYMPVLALTLSIAAAWLLWMIKRMIKPPMGIFARKG
jgi:hypothetical protein